MFLHKFLGFGKAIFFKFSSFVEKWANGFENYTFDENNGITIVSVDIDTTEDFLDYMNQTYPKALDKLKEICEK